MAEQTASEPPSPLIPILPDDVSIQCLARVPRYHHPKLALVCKSWHSAIRSLILFSTRSLLGATQTFLYLNLRVNSSFYWYILLQKPSLTSFENPRKLFPVPPIPTQPIGPAFVVLGPKIYVIGGSIKDIPSNFMWVFDCRFHRWEMGPKMKIGREFAAAGVVNGKIFVMGGCAVDNWARKMNWAEVFDPETESWAAVPSPIEVREKWMHASAVVGGRIYAMADRGGVVYDVGLTEWGSVPKRMDLEWRGRAAVVDGVLYCYDYLGKIRGYDVEKDVWKELKGVEKGLPNFLCGATMLNFNGRLCVVWEGRGRGKEAEIMCAEIDVRKDGDGGLSGRIMWSDLILMAPRGAAIINCLAVET